MPLFIELPTQFCGLPRQDFKNYNHFDNKFSEAKILQYFNTYFVSLSIFGLQIYNLENIPELQDYNLIFQPQFPTLHILFQDMKSWKLRLKN